jgi:dTDP-glucose 4,6-dehydratase
MSKIVYVTGCLGFIGAYVTEACLKQGWRVIGVDKITYAARSENLDHFERQYGVNHFKFIKSDINDLDTLYECDYVINTAAETHVDNSIVSSDEFIHSNINGVKHLLDLIRLKSKFKMPTLVHFSTDEVYGDIQEGAHTETHLLKPSNPYSATKAAADMLVTAWGRTWNVPYIIVRPTNNYGVGQYVEKLIPKICKSIILDKKVPLHNNGTPKRVWLHAQDTANAIITIINKNENYKCLNQIYNIGGDTELPNIDVVQKVHALMIAPVAQSLNWKDDICDFNYIRIGQDVRYSLDDSKLRLLGWKNECKLDIELPSVIEYYKNNFIW